MKIDPESEYYRVCPECKREFIADHLSMKFCHNRCRDHYHNRIKRDERIEEGSKQVQVSEAEKLRQELEANIKILEGLDINPKGTNFHLVDLAEKGFVFAAYGARVPLDPSGQPAYLKYGPYNIYLINLELIKIGQKTKP